MGLWDWVTGKNRKGNALAATMEREVQKKRQAGVPEDYERFEDAWPTGLAANVFNTANELKDFLELYQIHPWIYSAVTAISTACAGVPYQVLDEKGHEVKDDEIVHTLGDPNPHQVWFDFMEVTFTYLELTGNCFWEEVKDEKGNVLAIYPLRPDKVKIVPHPKTKVAGYIYEPVPGREIFYSPTEVTHIKYHSSLDEYWGISPAYAAQNSIILDMYSTAYNKKFFTNSAVPEGVLETDGSISDQTYRRLRQEWIKRHQGVGKAFELAILEEGLKYKPIGFNQRDMMMVEMKDQAKEDVLSAFRVPPVMVGLLKHANFSSTREQRKMFYMDNILPKLEKLKQIVNKYVMPVGRKLNFKIDNIHSIIEDIQISTQIAMSLVSHGIHTINEVRRMFFGLGPVAWGNKPWMPTGLAQWDPNAATQPHPEGHPSGQGPEKPVSGVEAENESTPMGGSLPDPDKDKDVKETKTKDKTVGKAVDFEKILPPEPNWDDSTSVRDWRVWSLWKGSATPDYIELRRMQKSFFAEQLARFSPIIKRAFPDPKADKVRKSATTKLIEEIYQGPYLVFKGQADYVPQVEKVLLQIDWDDEDDKLKAKYVPKAKKMIAKHGKTVLAQINSSSTFKINNKAVTDFLKEQGGRYISGINKTTRKAVGRQLAMAMSKGEDNEDVLERLTNVLSGDLSYSRVRAIARTETITLTQWARLEAAHQSGVVTKKRWICQQLPTSREREDGEDHVSMHGVEVGIDEPFLVQARKGVDKMYTPGDPDGSPENIVQCLCILDFPGTVAEFEDLEELDPVGTRKSEGKK